MPRRRPKTRTRFPAAVTIGSLRLLNTYESSGIFEGRFSRLDDLVLQHLHVQRALEKLTAVEECVVRMMVEEYTYADICEETGLSRRTIVRLASQMRMSLYGQNSLAS